MSKILTLLIVTSLALYAQTFNVTTTEEFRTALQDAAQNGEDDTIILADGTYSTIDDGQGTFEYLDNEVYDLTIKGSSAENVILDGNAEHRIFRHNSIDRADLYLEKLTFVNGGYEDYTGFNGGGFLVIKAAVTINDCNFTNNQAYSGGGFHMGNTPNDLNITNTVFENNVASNGFGGGGFFAYAYYGGNYTTIKDSKFINNITNGQGGGFYSKDVTVENSVFYKNRSINGHGGGFYADSYVDVSDCNFTENGAYGTLEPYNYREGGGFYAYQSGSVNNSIFVRNTAGLKGGGLLVRGSLKILNSSLIRNTLLSTLATAEGAGLFAGVGVVSNCIIKDNHTYGIGGGLSFSGVLTNSIIINNYAELAGGAMSSPNGSSNLYISNTIFAHNNSGIALSHIATVEDPNIIKNSVFVDVNDSIIEAPSGEPIVSIKNNYINLEKVSSDLQLFLRNNIYDSITLGFVDQVNQDYHLTASSDLLDTGTNDNADKFVVGVYPTYVQVNYLERDLDDNNRSVGANMDMGAYEYSTTKPTIIDFTFTGEAKEYHELTFNVTYNLTNGRTVQSIEYDYMNDGNFVTTDTHTYTEAKTYTVHARVTDDAGEFSLRTISVQIENLPYEDMTDEQKLKEAVDPQYYEDIQAIISAAIADAEQSGQQYVIDNPSKFNLGNIQEIQDGCRDNPQSCDITPNVVVIPLG